MSDPGRDAIELLQLGLSSVHKLKFSAAEGGSPIFEAVFSVRMIPYGQAALLSLEEGSAVAGDAGGAKLTNTYRWTFNRASVRLEHLRHGPGNAVFLADFHPRSSFLFLPAKPFLCGDDCYTARLERNASSVELRWEVRGPQKNLLLRLAYS